MRTRQAGFSLVEVLLAIVVFSFMTTALIGALMYGRGSAIQSGSRVRATQLADEGVQAARNIGSASYGNLVAGTYGLAQSGGVWNFSGSSDSTGIYTRQVTITAPNADRRMVTSTVSWQDTIGGTRQVSVTSELTNWTAAIKSWINATASGTLNTTGTNDSYKIATAGNYAYVITSAGTPNFLVVNIATPSAPTLVGSLTIATNPTNIFISGNYAYVASSGDSTELQVVNVSNPASPVLTSSYNAAGTADGLGVYVSGNVAYLSRAANSGSGEFLVINVATPASPTLSGSYGNNVAMNDVVVKGTSAFIGTSTGLILVVNVATPTAPALLKSYTPTTTGAVTALAYFNNTLLVGQATTLGLFDITTPSLPTLLGKVTTTGSTPVRDIDVEPTYTYAFIATANTTGEFQVVNIATPSTPVIGKVVDVSGTTSTLSGVAYNASQDIVVGASASDTAEFIDFVKN
jgi:prepilin-type N-terminal cleavage/methylation domain-containing protein